MLKSQARQGDDLSELKIGQETPENVSLGLERVFPFQAVQKLALDLSRSLDCHVPTVEAEAAVVSFVLALKIRG